jgi:hypothetical protein
MKSLKILSIFIILTLGACSDSKDKSNQIVKPLPDSMVLLEYPGGSIRAGDIKDQVAPELQKMRDQVVQLYRDQALASAYTHLLEGTAKHDGFPTTAAWLEAKKAEIQISDADVSNYMKANHLKDSSSSEIKKFLEEQAWISKKKELEEGALKSNDLKWAVSPAVHSLKNDLAGMSSGSGSTFEIHEFCDFKNVLCATLDPGIEKIAAKYKDKITSVFHPLPSALSESVRLATASICAGKQKHLHEFAQAAFASDTSALTDEAISAKIGMDMPSFKKCMTSASSALASEKQMALQAGIIDSPAVFVNGERVNSLDEIEAKIAEH